MEKQEVSKPNTEMDYNAMMRAFHFFGSSLNLIFHPIMTMSSDPKVIRPFRIKAMGNPAAMIRNIVLFEENK